MTSSTSFDSEEYELLEAEYGWTTSMLLKGQIFPMSTLKMFCEEIAFDRLKAIKERYQHAHAITGGIMPVHRNFKLRISAQKCRSSKIVQIIEWMLVGAQLDADDIYMYNPTGTGTGYKYYRGERIIVYQVGPYLSRNERFQIEKQILCDKPNGYSLEKPNRVYKMVIMEMDIPILRDWDTFDAGSEKGKTRIAFLTAWNGRIFNR